MLRLCHKATGLCEFELVYVILGGGCLEFVAGLPMVWVSGQLRFGYKDGDWPVMASSWWGRWALKRKKVVLFFLVGGCASERGRG